MNGWPFVFCSHWAELGQNVGKASSLEKGRVALSHGKYAVIFVRYFAQQTIYEHS